MEPVSGLKVLAEFTMQRKWIDYRLLQPLVVLHIIGMESGHEFLIRSPVLTAVAHSDILLGSM